MAGPEARRWDRESTRPDAAAAPGQDGSHYAPAVVGPQRFLVLWGQMGKPHFRAEIVEAFDPDEALTVAAGLHPELHRPRVAVPAAEAGPLARRYADTDGGPTTEE